MRIGLLPAAGTASRMKGLPKFLLPLSENLPCLIDYHVQLMAPGVDTIIIPTRPEWVGVLEGFQWGDRVQIRELTTHTMAETVRRSLEGESYDRCVLGLPDTYFVDENPYEELSAVPSADLSLWAFRTRPEQSGKVGSVLIDESHRVLEHADKEPDRDFGWHWGVFEFHSDVEEFLDPSASTGGYLIDECLQRGLDVRGYASDKPYFDCGTVSEYRQCLTYLETHPPTEN